MVTRQNWLEAGTGLWIALDRYMDVPGPAFVPTHVPVSHYRSIRGMGIMNIRTTDGLMPRDSFPPSPGTPPSEPAAPAVARQPLRRTVRVLNPLGLHQRAADRFSRAAKRYNCGVTIWNGDRKADGKDLWDLIMLSVFPDTEVVLEVDGADAAAALEPLANILGAANGEDYTI